MSVGEKIQWLRKQAGLSQEQLADQLQVSRQAVSKWEGDIHLPELDKCMELCRIFNVSLDELLLNEEIKKSGLTDQQMKELLQVVTSMKQEKTKKRYVVVKVGICILLTIVLGSILADNNHMKNEISSLNNSLNHLAYEISNQSSSLQNAVNEALQAQGSLLSRFHTEIMNYDIENRKATIQVYAVPKTYQKNTKIQVQFLYDEGITEFVTLNREKNEYVGMVEVPLSNIWGATVMVDDSTGTVKQMGLDLRLDVLDNICLTRGIFYNDIDATSHQKDDKFMMEFHVKFDHRVIDHCAEAMQRQLEINGKPIRNRLASYSREIYVNGKKIDACTYQGKDAECNLKVELKEGDTFAYKHHYTDTLGFEYWELIDEATLVKSSNGSFEPAYQVLQPSKQYEMK